MTKVISTELVDRLNAEGPASKYHLSTCGGTKVVKYGQRVTGVVIRSIHGKTSVLPPLIEYDGIPQDMKEIPTPEIAREHRHLGSIAEEIPPFDEEAKIHLLIGRDTPELLKVRAFKNSPKGAPWAQKLALEWTISGQTCLHLKDRPIHVQTKRTCVVTDYSRTWMYILLPIWFPLMSQHIQHVTQEVQEKSQDSRMSKYTSLPRKFHHGRWRRKHSRCLLSDSTTTTSTTTWGCQLKIEDS